MFWRSLAKKQGIVGNFSPRPRSHSWSDFLQKAIPSRLLNPYSL